MLAAIVSRSTLDVASGRSYLFPQSGQPLLLGMRVDVCSDHKRNNIEERHPSLFGQEFLGKRKGQWRGNPANLHDRHETGPDRSSYLMECSRAGYYSHGGKVYRILDWCYL